MNIVTCRTPDCPSAGRQVAMDLDWVGSDGKSQAVDAVVCGACGAPITDVAAD